MTRATTRRSLGFVVGCLAVLFVAGGARAAMVVGDLGELQPGDSDVLAFLTTDSARLAAGEIFQFTVNTESIVDTAATAINLPPTIGISGFGVSLIEDTSGDFSTFDTLATGAFDGSAWILSYAGLLDGNLYGFLFTGTITGTSGGSYAATYSVSAVPLPPAIWLSLSALIALAGVVRHQRKRSTATPPKRAVA